MERQYPPFGQIPGPLPASPHIIRQTPQAALSLTSFQVLPTGLLAILRTSTHDPALVDVTYSFEAMSAGEQTQLEIWVEASRDEGGGRVAANLADGSRGQDEGIESRVYTLWFPIDLAEAERALTVHLTWPEAGIEHETVTLEASDIPAALALAYLPWRRRNGAAPWDADAEAVLPLSGRILQWRSSDGAWRSLASRDDEADLDFQPWTGDAGVLIQADGDVWRKPSWLVAWGELPESGKVEVLRTDAQSLELTVVGRVWACEWIGQGEPVTVRYDDGFPQTVRIDRPDFL